MKKIPIILDCDPGIDDALALVVAYSLEQLDVKAVTCVAGNVSIEKVANSARAVLGTLGVTSKIYQGASCPLMAVDVIEAADVHGETGLGYFKTDEKNWHPLEKMSALEAQKKILLESDEPVTIAAVGPLTNIAILLKAYPELKSKIKQLSIMGGGLYTGNHTAAGEFNFLADPEAAHIVFSSGVPIIMAGLDVTHQARIYGKEIEEIVNIGNPVADMMSKAMSFNFGKYKEGDERDNEYVHMHDVCSVLVLVYPEIFKGQDMNIMIETSGRYSRGYSLADMRRDHKGENTNAHVLLEIDRDRFYEEVMKSIKSYT